MDDKQQAHPESFDRLMAEVSAVTQKWDALYRMPSTDAICAAFDAIEERLDTSFPTVAYQAGIRYVPLQHVAFHMADELWNSRYLPSIPCNE